MERAVVESPWEGLLSPLLQGMQQMGIIQPEKVVIDLEWAVNKARGSLLTDNNTKLRPQVRVMLVHLLSHCEALVLDPSLLLLVTMKSAVPDLLRAAASARINRLVGIEVEGDGA